MKTQNMTLAQGDKGSRSLIYKQYELLISFTGEGEFQIDRCCALYKHLDFGHRQVIFSPLGIVLASVS